MSGRRARSSTSRDREGAVFVASQDNRSLTVAARSYIGVTLVVAVLSFLAGCADAVQAGHNTALDSVDLTTMTDDMASSMLADAEVRAAIEKEGKLRVVVQPVENRLTAEVLPRGPAEAFTARVRTLLSQRAPEHFTFVMNLDAWKRLRKKELEGIDVGPSPDSINPRYALTARFSSLADETKQRRTSYYLCVYELSDLETRDVLWTGRYEVKKIAVKGFLD